VHRDESVLSFAQIDKLYHEFKLILVKKHAHGAFNWYTHAYAEMRMHKSF